MTRPVKASSLIDQEWRRFGTPRGEGADASI
jgi:hypothetical protein